MAHLNEYFSRMVPIVFAHKGTIDKFVGDMIMALFGAPLDDPDHADHAVETALAMSSGLAQLNHGWTATGRPALDIGIGINTGDMVAGNLGSEDIMSYTVIGDQVNLGARLESLNKDFHTRVIISDATRAALKGRYDIRALGQVVVKGKSVPVEIFSVVPPTAALDGLNADGLATDIAGGRFSARTTGVRDVMKFKMLGTIGVAALGLVGPGGGVARRAAERGQLGSVLKRAQQARDIQMTDEEEQKLGEAVSERIRQRYGVVQDAAIHKYVTLVGIALAQASTRPNLHWRFIVLDTDGVNALAAPGGLVHITRGALSLIKSEAELAGVIGHESSMSRRSTRPRRSRRARWCRSAMKTVAAAASSTSSWTRPLVWSWPVSAATKSSRPTARAS